MKNQNTTKYTVEELIERMNFSSTKDNCRAIKIGKNHNVNFGETLLQYCADKSIFADLDENGYDTCERIMSQHGQADLSIDHYYFWICEDWILLKNVANVANSWASEAIEDGTWYACNENGDIIE